MTKKLQQNQWAKAESASWLLSPAKKIEQFIFYLLILFLPTQFGKHFWFDFSYVVGGRIDYLSPTLYLTDIFIVVPFFISFFQKKIHVHPFFSLVTLFISVSIFLSGSPMVGWYYLVKFLELSFLVWYVANNSINKTVVGLLLTAGIVFESALSVSQIFHQGSVGGIVYFLGERAFSASTPGIANASVSGELILRPYATFSHPNMLAGYLIVAMLLMMHFFSSNKSVISSVNEKSHGISRAARTIKLLSLATLLFGTVGLALSLGRAAIATWLLIGCITIVVTYKERVAKNLLLLSLSVGTALLLVAVFFPPVVARLFSFSLGESLSERASLAQSALSMIFSRPFFGVGPNNFISSLPFFSKNSFVLQPVHNVYLLVGAELGIPGIILFCGFLWSIIKRFYLLWRKSLVVERNRLLPLGLALFAILFLGFFDHYFLTLQQGQLLFALVIGLISHEIHPPHGTIEK